MFSCAPRTGAKTVMPPLDSTTLALQYPTSVLRIWGGSDQARGHLREAVLDHCHAIELADGGLAITPRPGDPAVFDAGLHWSRKILANLEASDDGPRILISPAELLLRGSEVLGVHDDVGNDVVAA